MTAPSEFSNQQSQFCQTHFSHRLYLPSGGMLPMRCTESAISHHFGERMAWDPSARIDLRRSSVSLLLRSSMESVSLFVSYVLLLSRDILETHDDASRGEGHLLALKWPSSGVVQLSTVKLRSQARHLLATYVGA